MAFGDLVNLITGQPTAEQQIGNYATQQQGQNRLAVGLNPDGTPRDPNQPPPSGTLPANQEPNATKTPQSLGELMMSLARENEANQLMAQGTGAIFSGFAQPRDREAVSKIFNTTPMDPIAATSAIQQLGSNQQGQDRLNSLGLMINNPDPKTGGPAIAARLNISWEELKAQFAANPAGVGAMITQFASPTDQMKNLQQIDYYTKLVQSQPGATSADTQAITDAIKANIGGPDAYKMIAAQIAWRNSHPPGTPPPWRLNDPQSFAQYTANEAQKEDDRGKASSTLATTQQTAEELRGNLETLRDSPGLKSILASSAKREAARGALQNTSMDLSAMVARNILTQDEANAVALLRKINGTQTGEALHSLAGTGTRVTQQEVGPLAAAISTTADLNQDYPNYVTGAINPLITKTKKLVATTYGASGNFSGMDPEYNPWVPAIFRKNGGLYKEGGGAENIPDLGPVPPDQLAAAKNHLKDVPIDKEDVLDHLQQQGYDVTRLRKTPPSQW